MTKRALWEMEEEEDELSLPCRPAMSEPHHVTRLVPSNESASLREVADMASSPFKCLPARRSPVTWALALRAVLGHPQQLSTVKVRTTCSGTGAPMLSLKARMCHLHLFLSMQLLHCVSGNIGMSATMLCQCSSKHFHTLA